MYEVVQVSVHIFNPSVRTGEFPDQLKVAVVVPSYKNSWKLVKLWIIKFLKLLNFFSSIPIWFPER